VDRREIEEVITRGLETRNIEMKQSMDLSDKAVKAKIAKQVMGLANIRDGGVLILGTEKRPNSDYHDPAGMNASHLKGYSQDRLGSVVSHYAAPFAELFASIMQFADTPSLAGKQFVVISVLEFAEIPILCKLSHQGEGLREGGIYIRSRERFETREVRSEAEMRELLDLATEKRLRKHLELTEKAGGIILPAVSAQEADRARFEAEAEEFLT